jgi:hypothetical protein
MMHHHKRQAGVDAASFDPRRARAALAAIATRLEPVSAVYSGRASSSVGQGFRVSE